MLIKFYFLLCRLWFVVQMSGSAPNMSAPYPNHSYNPVMAAPVGAPLYNYTAPGVGRKPMSSELLNDSVHIPQPVQIQVQVPKLPVVKEPSTGMFSVVKACCMA